jgi:hypothetical protein
MINWINRILTYLEIYILTLGRIEAFVIDHVGNTVCEDFPFCRQIGLKKSENVIIKRGLGMNNKFNSSSTDGTVMYSVYCPFNITHECQKIANAFAVTGNYISSVLKFKIPIKVKVEIVSFCERDTSARCQKILANARPSSYYTISEKPNVIYPQALIRHLGSKQIDDEKQEKFQIQEEKFMEYDMVITLNMDNYDKLFMSSSNRIDPLKYDFNYILLHEQLHGLGMMSIFKNFTVKSLEKHSESILLPSSSVIFEDQIISIGNLSIFDYFIHDSFGSWKERIKIIRNMISDTKTLGPEIINVAHELYIGATKDPNLKFQGYVNNNHFDLKLLNSPDGFITGSTASHITEDNSVTDNFLMRPHGPKGVKLEELISLYSINGSPFGKKILLLLVQMGYDLQDDFIQANYEALNTSSEGFKRRVDRYFSLIFLVIIFFLS